MEALIVVRFSKDVLSVLNVNLLYLPMDDLLIGTGGRLPDFLCLPEVRNQMVFFLLHVPTHFGLIRLSATPDTFKLSLSTKPAELA